MKIQKSNNPLAVGALLCVLALIIGRTIWLVTRGDGSAQMVTAVPSATAQASVASPMPRVLIAPQNSASSPMPSPAAPPRSARNPFATHHATPPNPSLKSPAERTATPPVNAHPANDADLSAVRPLPVAPLPVAPPPATRLVGSQPRTAALTPPVPTVDPLLNIHLTAIVDGTRRMAVLQTTDPQPLIIHEGDRVQGLHVAAIHEKEVVFTQGDTSWTLPMQTADTPVTVTPAVVPPAAQENNVDATP